MFDRPMEPDDLDTSANALVFETADMGKLMVLFTAPEHAELIRDDLGEFAHPGQLAGEYVVSSLAPDTGIIMNPGHDLGMKLSAEGLSRLKSDFGASGGLRGGGDTGAQGGGTGTPPAGGMPFPQLN